MSLSSPGLNSCCFAHAEGERGRVAEIVAIVVVASRAKEPQVAPATLVCEGENARQRRLRDDGEIEALARVSDCPVKAIEKMRASGAGPFALRPEHEAVDCERVLAGREQLRQLHLDRLVLRGALLENVVFSELPAGRKRATLRGDPLDLPTELDLLVEERVTGPSVDFALVRKVQVVKGLGRGSGKGDHVPVPSECELQPNSRRKQ
jgi:hypothetical protein